jgi:hypothetical protein
MKAIGSIAWALLALANAAWFAGCGRESTSSAPASKASPATPEPNVANAINLPGVFVAKGIRLELLPNGRYRMRVHAESANADLDSEGRWSLSGGDLQLDPDDSSEPTRTYMTWSKDAFESSDGSYSLVREGKR